MVVRHPFRHQRPVAATGEVDSKDEMFSKTMISELELPKVSVIIVNYNYSAFLRQAFGSVVSQTYPNIEIVIVDDKSTDDSKDVIDGICSADPAVKAVMLPVNGGQSVASQAGFDVASGAYVLFLDADDVLLPRCVEAHVYAHLSSRIPVAFSSVDIWNNVGGSDVNTSHDGFSTFVQGKQGLLPTATRPVDECAPGSWFGEREPPLRLDQIHFVLPPQADPWVWSPASANCYRRDAVDIMFDGASLHAMRWGTDLYLIRALSSLFGSVLIDKPLVRYVIHGGNSFIKSAPLNKYAIFDSTATSDHMRIVARSSIAQLLAKADVNAVRYEDPHAFFRAVKSVSESFPGRLPSERPGEYYRRTILADRPRLERLFGAGAIKQALAPDTKLASVLEIFSNAKARLSRSLRGGSGDAR